MRISIQNSNQHLQTRCYFKQSVWLAGRCIICEVKLTAVNSPFVVVTEKRILQMLTFFECVVWSPSVVYANTINLFNLGK